MAGNPRKTSIVLASGNKVHIYAGTRVSSALAEVTEDFTLTKGVRLLQVLEAVYEQGKRDGARDAFEQVRKATNDAQKMVPHRNPGRPKRG
jgi:hypothetical protein